MPGDFETVKERIDIVQLIGERVPLRKAGRAYKGLCPFHAEKTPSFTVDPDRRTYKCFGCLPPGSLIKTAQGPRRIEALRVGDLVYGGDGRLHPILLTHEHRFAGDLVRLRCAPFKIPLLLTPNHRVPVLRPKSRRLEEVEAGSIRVQNYLVYPAIQRTPEDLDWSAPSEWFGTRGIRPKPLPVSVDVTLFAEWLGWYLAEGSVSNDRTVRFSLGGDESPVAERLGELTARLFGERLRADHRESTSSIELWFCHALLARWLKRHCGDGAQNKRLPSFVWNWTPQQQWSVFHALILGDASISPGRYVERYGYSAQASWALHLASPGLIDDVRDLLIFNGIVPAVTERAEPDGRMSWAVTVTADAQQRWGSGEHPSSQPIPVRVRRVDRVAYDGPVYNLTVADEHTYVTMSGTVNNCGEGGDVFTWLEKLDGLEPAEALRVLAERAGVELTRRAPEEREGEKRLLAVHDTAHFYFRQAYRGTTAGRAAAAYVAGRGIVAQTAEKFGLGYAPELRDGLLGYLRKKGFNEEEAVTSGLVIRTERGLLDRFRDRLMIPLRDGKGRIVAFAGRAMRADQPGKYVNSPQTPLFTKSGLLFALDLARPAMRRKGEVVIVEGQLDAIACHQTGFDNVVASMGTALTEEQYRIIGRLKIGRAIVAFDGDAAGIASAEKRGRDLVHVMRRFAGGRISTSSGVLVYVAPLPAGEDPDTLARSDPERLRTILEVRDADHLEGAARPVLDFVIDKVAARFDLGGPDGRRRFLAETLPLLTDEPDELTRELYLGTLSRLTGVDQEALRRQTAGAPDASAAGPPGAPAPAGGRETKQTSSLERYLMAQLLQFPEAAARVDLAPDDLADPELRAIFELLRSGRPSSDFPAPLAARAAALGAQTPEPVTETDPGRVIEIAALRLREQVLRRRLGETRAALARTPDGDAAGTEREVERLGAELEELMRSRERHTVLRAEEREEGR